MDTTEGLHRESTQILAREIEDVVDIREHLVEMREIARRDARALLSPLDRMGASLHAFEEELGARLHELGDTLSASGHAVLPRRYREQPSSEEPLRPLLRLFASLVRQTRIRTDVVRSYGDAKSARLLAQVRRGLVVLQWHASLCAHGEHPTWRD